MAIKKKAAIWVTAFCTIALGGCAPFPMDPSPATTLPHDATAGGQTLKQMQDSLEKIPGLVFTQSDGGERPNVKGYGGYQFSITVDPEWAIVDGPQLVTFLAHSAWSVREGYMPNGLIAIDVTDVRGSSFDVAEAASIAGWIEPREPEPRDSGYTSTSIVMYDGSPARERLGSWPGPVPTVPTDITARITDREATPNG